MVLTKEQIIASLGDVEILTLTIYGEARGEPIEGQIAVACVIRNRFLHTTPLRTHNTYEQICLAPDQFSCWNDRDPNRGVLDEFAEKLIHGMKLPLELRQQVWIAKGVINGDLRDNTNGARNYLERKLFESGHAPRWAMSMHPIKFIGNHVFGSAL